LDFGNKACTRRRAEPSACARSLFTVTFYRFTSPSTVGGGAGARRTYRMCQVHVRHAVKKVWTPTRNLLSNYMGRALRRVLVSKKEEEESLLVWISRLSVASIQRYADDKTKTTKGQMLRVQESGLRSSIASHRIASHRATVGFFTRLHPTSILIKKLTYNHNDTMQQARANIP
jgi:hypothetical protein